MSKRPKWVSSYYGRLYDVLKDAYLRTASTKGLSRHHLPRTPIEQQGTVQRRLTFGPGVTLGQAGKKMEEAGRLWYKDRRNELLDAMDYIALEIIALDIENKVPEEGTKDGEDITDEPEQAEPEPEPETTTTSGSIESLRISDVSIRPETDSAGRSNGRPDPPHWGSSRG